MPNAFQGQESAILIPASQLVEFRSRSVYKNLDELAKSLIEHGQIEPIIVRKKAGDDGVYEVAAGTRRRRASFIAGLPSLLAIVRDLSDQEMVEISIAENRDREDIHPLEEADGLVELHDTFGMSIGELAEKFGRSDEYIYGRLRIAAMCVELRNAFLAGRFGVKAALVLAGIADTMQVKVWAELAKLPDATLSASKVAGFIRDRFLLRLSTAQFPLDDGDLVEEAGSCTRCPKRTGVQASLFPEDLSGDDRCTDVDCFTSKKRAFADVLVERAQEKGLRVLELKEAREVFKYGESVDTLNPDCSFVAVDGRARLAEEGVSYRDLLAKGPPPVVIAINPSGGGIELYEKAAVSKAMRALKVPFVKEWESVCLPKTGEKPSAEKKQDKGEAKIERKAAEAAIDALRTEVEQSFGKTGGKTGGKAKKLLQLVALGAARNTWAQVQKAYIKKHGLDDGKTGGDANARILAMLEDHISKMSEAECVGFVFEIALLREVFGAAGGPDVRAELFDRSLAVTGFKFATFRKDVEKEQNAPKDESKANGRTSTPAKSKARGKASKRASKEASSGEGEEGSGAGGMCAICSCTREEPCKREKGPCTRDKGEELCSHCEDVFAVVKSVVDDKANPFRLSDVFGAVYHQDLVEDCDGDRDLVRECLNRLVEDGACEELTDGRFRRLADA